MTTQSNPGRGLRPKEAAERLGCSIATFYRNAKTVPGWPKIIKLCDRISITTEASIAEFIAQCAAKK